MRRGTFASRSHCLYWLVAVGLLTAIAPPATAQVVLERLADGTVLITNQGSRSRPVSSGATSGVLVVERSQRSAKTGRRASVEMEEWVRTHAGHNRLEEKLVMAVIAAESAFNPSALSAKGAIGLMQLLPETALDLGIEDPWDPESNIRGGTRYLRQMLDLFGDNVELALAAYNAGPGAVTRNGGVPPYRETRDYIRRVLSRYHGRDVGPSGVRVASQAAYRPIKVSRDANGHLVILTP